MDLIFNGQAHGSVANKLATHGYNALSLRPYLSDCGQYSCISVANGRLNDDGSPMLEPRIIGNAESTLQRDVWKQIDETVVKVSKERLRAVADLKSAGLTYNIPNGMGKTVLETGTQGDISPASVSMDGLRKNANDRPVWDYNFLPLPIIHKDFSFSQRQIAESQNGGAPLDLTMAEASARRVAEEAEKMLLGVSTVANEYSFGGGKIYGYTDFPNRITSVITSPTDSTWTGTVFLREVLAMLQLSRNELHFGPWVLYVASAWDEYLDDDFKAASDKSIRSRVMEVNDLNDIRTLDYLTGFDMVLVQMTSDVVREVIGMDIITVQWDTDGGLMKNFKIMTIIVPQLRADQNGNTGIVHGSPA